ncbi:hypothetical protein LGV61_12465 [Desulfurispirillum indicum]|uniref:PssD/Cps14F family polysaccharide biosynthesis glycosyltransferase n=1 Tax=Desulfurispirillum indicum TaxID=936456 RepID=UPI001CF930B2|nr:hypothetical protein LGV61_12465 [Desulfurispirillum indicum]
MLNEERILLVFGGGGHSEQMRRLLSYLEGRHHVQYLAIKESGASIDSSTLTDEVEVQPLRDKQSEGTFFMLLNSIVLFCRALTVAFNCIRQHRIKLLLSSGPGIAVPVSLVAKILSCRVVHIETNSRFSSKSFTGRFMYYIADDFLIQNKELAMLYPQAKYVGRL